MSTKSLAKTCWQCFFCDGEFSNPEQFAKHKLISTKCKQNNPEFGFQGNENEDRSK